MQQYQREPACGHGVRHQAHDEPDEDDEEVGQNPRSVAGGGEWEGGEIDPLRLCAGPAGRLQGSYTFVPHT